jgi:hypothetical protein
MIWHTVWFQLKDGVSAEDRAAMQQSLRALRGEIDGILHLGCGEDFSGRSGGYQIGLVVGFASRAALDAYGPHPKHQAFIEQFKPMWEDVKALDFDALD